MKRNIQSASRAGALIVLVALLAVLALFGTGCEGRKQTPAAQNETVTPTEAPAITADRAKEIALADAGLTADQVTFIEAKPGEEDGLPVFEIEFRTADAEYEYEIDAATGRIYSRSVERYALPAEDGQEAVNLKRAKQIALDDAGLAADRVTFTKARRGEEDGRFVFEIEFHTDDAEYEYEIDAATGAIRDQSVEPMPRTATGDQNEATPAANAIGLDRAKQIALADAGLPDAKFTREEEDEEDGRPVYELRFRTQDAEYNYEIDARTGEILKSSVDEVKEPQSATPSTSYIGVDAAKQTALQRAGKTADAVIFTKAKLEREDGKQVYEIEFYAGEAEYSCTVDAQTGSVLAYEAELDDRDEDDDHDEDDERDEDDDD